MRQILLLLSIGIVASGVLIFPLGYQDQLSTVRNAPLFDLSADSGRLRESENQNFNSSAWSANETELVLSAKSVDSPQSWSFETVTGTVNFPSLAGTDLNFSGSFSGLNLTSAAIRVVLIFTHLPSVATLYYLIGNPSIPSNAPSYNYYGISIPSNGTTFSAHRDIAEDLSAQGTGVNDGWDMRSVSFGFVIYPSSSTAGIPVRVTFDSNRTAVDFSKTRIETSYSSVYSPVYYAGTVLVSVAGILLCNGEPLIRAVRRFERCRSLSAED